jgi:hypothetical protein
MKVRGVPGSGKTVLLNLLHRFILRESPRTRVYRINGWPQLEFNGFWRRIRQITGDLPDDLSPAYLLFDEAQETYHDDGLWNGFFKSLDSLAGWRVILFCSFGSPSRHAGPQKYGTPAVQSPSQRLLLRSTEDFPFGLLLSYEEVEQVIEKYNLNLAKNVCHAIFDWTGGHAGCVGYLLNSIRSKVRQCFVTLLSFTYTYDV